MELTRVLDDLGLPAVLIQLISDHISPYAEVTTTDLSYYLTRADSQTRGLWLREFLIQGREDLARELQRLSPGLSLEFMAATEDLNYDPVAINLRNDQLATFQFITQYLAGPDYLAFKASREQGLDLIHDVFGAAVRPEASKVRQLFFDWTGATGEILTPCCGPKVLRYMIPINGLKYIGTLDLGADW